MKYLNVRGTNGSGKTTIARAFFDESTPVSEVREGKKVRLYVRDWNGIPLYILGSYEAVCGGCDTIPEVGIVADLLGSIYGDTGVCLYEGLMISHMLGTVGSEVEAYGSDHVMAFLDTPLETCIQRVVGRRHARGDFREFDPKNVIKDHKAVSNCRQNAIKKGFRVIDLDHTNAKSICDDIIRTFWAEEQE